MALNLKKISNKEDDTIHTNHLHFQISGNNIDHVIVNSLRRIILEELPGFAYDSDSIKISENTTGLITANELESNTPPPTLNDDSRVVESPILIDR